MRYIIGVDLGTTNSSVCFVDSQSPHLTIQQFNIPQLISAGYVDSLASLPSYCYLFADGEWPKGSLNLPWEKANATENQSDFFVGSFARQQGSKVPTRLVQSAKSWLCHKSANRREKILPTLAAEGMPRISPVEASKRYLSHIGIAWNFLMSKGNPDLEFSRQEIVLTVPASFDEVARALTAEAAVKAGLQHMTLLEEPQAAFYSWLSRHESSWQKLLPLGSKVLICDVGGGTTDFSLIEVLGSEELPKLQRMAVGDHLLLGGDNMDAAVAHYIESKLSLEESTPLQWMQLVHQARMAKESLLGNPPVESFQVILQGSGSSVIGGSRTLMISRQEIENLLQEGFFGQYSWDEASKSVNAVGIRTMGLPYENEPSICKHLAQFLKKSSSTTDPAKPDFVLFNGGTMKPDLFQNAVMDSLKRWFPESSPVILPSGNLDLAVGKGAAYYGKVRRGLGVRVGGGSARGYYLGVDIEQPNGGVIRKAISLLPRGCDEGAKYEPSHTFWLQPNTPAVFQLYSSHVRLNDASGDMVEIDPTELQLLPQVHSLLRFGKKVSDESIAERIPVHLGIHLNAIGTLELWLKSQQSDHRWTLEFQLRTVEGQENSLSIIGKARTDEQLESSTIEKAKLFIKEYFSDFSKSASEKLMESLELILDKPRRDWSLSILRALWPALPLELRRMPDKYQARWWNIAGFLLRPGFGFPLDDHRVKDLWKVILSEFNVANSSECQIQKWICYRRIAGGLNKGQQMQIAHELIPSILNKRNGRIEIKGKSELYQYVEKIRALASMELLEGALKIKLGDALIKRISSTEAVAADFWALARIGARHLLYGSSPNVVSKTTCSAWIEELLLLSPNEERLPFVLAQLAHKTDHREINIPEALINKIRQSYHSELLENALSDSHLSMNEQDQIFGEHLPIGLLLKIEGY